MTLTKKEKTMILVLAIMVYLFAFIKIVVVNSLPKIKEAQQKLQDVQKEKTALDAEYLNLENYKVQVQANKVVNERLGSYLMNNAGLADSIDFIEKLALLFDTELKTITLGQPYAMTAESANYFGFPVKFSAVFSYDSFNEIIEYCEGGSKKVSISGFTFKPSIEKDLYDVTLDLIFYSIDKESVDKLYQYSRSNFQKFKDRVGQPVFLTEDSSLKFEDTAPKEEQNAGINLSNADFVVTHIGYLFGGYNFEAFSSLDPSKTIRKTIEDKMDVFLKLSDSEYSIETVYNDGKKEVTSGSLPDRDYTMFIESNILTEVKENKNLYLNIKIQNESGNSIQVQVDQSGGRLKLMDRDGNEIKSKSDKEKIFFK